MAETPNYNKDAFRIRRGLDILGGNRLAGLIGSSNYQKIMRAYRKKYVKRIKGSDGQVFWFDEKTQKRVTEQDLHKSIITQVTGSKAPIKDLQYISAKNRATLESKLGALDDGVSVRDVLFNVRKQFSPKVYDETSGKFLGRETEIKRDARAALMLKAAEDKRKGTTYAQDDKAKRLEGLNLPNNNNNTTTEESKTDILKREQEFNTKEEEKNLKSALDENNKRNNIPGNNNNNVKNQALKASKKLDELKIKSDVFTIDPKTGEAVGVLTKRQREAFEARSDVKKALMKAQTSGDDLRIYKKDDGPNVQRYGG